MFARRENLYIGRKFITDKYFCRYFYSFLIFLGRFGRRTTVLGAIIWRPRKSFWHCEIYFLLIWAVSKYFLLPFPMAPLFFFSNWRYSRSPEREIFSRFVYSVMFQERFILRACSCQLSCQLSYFYLLRLQGKFTFQWKLLLLTMFNGKLIGVSTLSN